jgi:hypothetical protein
LASVPVNDTLAEALPVRPLSPLVLGERDRSVQHADRHRLGIARVGVRNRDAG